MRLHMFHPKFYCTPILSTGQCAKRRLQTGDDVRESPLICEPVPTMCLHMFHPKFYCTPILSTGQCAKRRLQTGDDVRESPLICEPGPTMCLHMVHPKFHCTQPHIFHSVARPGFWSAVPLQDEVRGLVKFVFPELFEVHSVPSHCCMMSLQFAVPPML